MTASFKHTINIYSFIHYEMVASISKCEKGPLRRRSGARRNFQQIASWIWKETQQFVLAYTMDKAGKDKVAAEILKGIVCSFISKLVLWKLTFI